MANSYSALPFQGSLRSGQTASAVASQLEALLNGASASSPEAGVCVVGPVSIQVQPGCLAGLLGAEASFLRYDQIIWGPPRAGTESSTLALIAGAAAQDQPANSINGESVAGGHAVEAPSEPVSHTSAEPSSLVTTWKGLPVWTRRASVLAGVLVVALWWRSGSKEEPRPAAWSPNGGVAVAPVPRIPPAPRPTPPAQVSAQSPLPVPAPVQPAPMPPAMNQAVAPSAVAQRPNLVPGDRWVTEVTDHQDARLNYRSERVVVSVDGGRVVTTAKTLKSNYTRTVEYDPDWGLLASRHPNGSTTTFSPALPYMQFPLQPGSEWSARSDETAATGERKVHNINARVTGWEQVRSLAGTFNALRIELSDRIEVDGSMVHEGKDVSWYVPSVKRSVRSEETSFDPKTNQTRRRTIELVEYQVR